MPPKIKIKKDDIFTVAIDITREHGWEKLNAREIAKILNCSTQPIFSNYKNMDELKGEVIAYAVDTYKNYLSTEINNAIYPTYKASGMGYIKFAREEKEFFKLLFMTKLENFNGEIDLNWQGSVDMAQKSSGCNKNDSELFHLEMWTTVHGIATMIATGYLDIDTNLASLMLSDIYNGLKIRFSGDKNESNKN